MDLKCRVKDLMPVGLELGVAVWGERGGPWGFTSMIDLEVATTQRLPEVVD